MGGQTTTQRLHRPAPRVALFPRLRRRSVVLFSSGACSLAVVCLPVWLWAHLLVHLGKRTLFQPAITRKSDQQMEWKHKPETCTCQECVVRERSITFDPRGSELRSNSSPCLTTKCLSFLYLVPSVTNQPSRS